MVIKSKHTRRDEKNIIDVTKAEAKLLQERFKDIFIYTTCRHKPAKRKKKCVPESIQYMRCLPDNLAARKIVAEYDKRNAWRKKKKAPKSK